MMAQEIEIHGHCDPHFERVKEVFAENFKNDLELGANFALSLGGKTIVDIWAGFTNPERTKPWQEDTVVQVSSTSKVICSLCGLKLIDMGLLDLDTPIASYWPEFAENGKQEIPVTQIFSHSAGLPGVDGFPGLDVIGNFEEMSRRLAEQKPWWEPGTKTGYHGMTFGILLGELVKRITGLSIEDFFTSHFSRPLDIDFQFGEVGLDTARFALVEQAVEEDADLFVPQPGAIWYRALGYTNDPDWQDKSSIELSRFTQSSNPSGNGVTNARALVEIGTLLASGGVAEGTRFLSKEIAALPYQEQSYRFDEVFYNKVRYGVGFGIASDEVPFPWPNTFHWGGAGGSAVIMVPELNMSWAYTPNKFYKGPSAFDYRGGLLKDAVIECANGL